MRNVLFSIAFIAVLVLGITQPAEAMLKNSFQLSTHILDTNTGTSPANVTVELLKQNPDKTWKLIDTKKTNSSGRVADFLTKTMNNTGVYKLRFHTGEYLALIKQKTIFPYIEIIFTIADKEHYHIPLLLSGNGYGTYRGN